MHVCLYVYEENTGLHTQNELLVEKFCDFWYVCVCVYGCMYVWWHSIKLKRQTINARPGNHQVVSSHTIIGTYNKNEMENVQNNAVKCNHIFIIKLICVIFVLI